MNPEEVAVSLMAALLISGILASVQRDIREADGIDELIPDAVRVARKIAGEATKQMNSDKETIR